MAEYEPGELVEVRAKPSAGWFKGTVVDGSGKFLVVSLDEPRPTQNAWIGGSARYGGHLPVDVVKVYKTDLPGDNSHIRRRQSLEQA